MLNKLLRNKKGFTLVELVAVIVIIGVLAGVATVVLTTVVKNNRIKAEMAEVETAFAACQSFMTEVNSGYSTISNPINVVHFQSRLQLSASVIEVGNVTNPPTYASPGGVYVRCIRDSLNGRYAVTELWYVVNDRVWSITATRTQYTDKDGTKIM